MFLSLKCKSCDVYYVVRLRLIVSLPKWGEGGGGVGTTPNHQG